MAQKKLDLYKLGVVLDVDGAKGLSTLAKTDKELKAVDEHGRKAEKSLGTLGGALNRLKAFTFGGSGSGGLLPGLSQISQIIQGIPQIGNLAHALVSPLKEAAEEGVRFNMLIESAEIGFKGVLGGIQQAKTYVKELTDFSAANRIFNTQATVRAARQMNVFGFETQKTTHYLKIWGSAIAAGGEFNEENLQGVVRAFGQMRSLGRVSAEDINQLQDRGIPAWELLAKAIGKTVAQTRKLSEQGKLNGAGAVDAITAMLDTDPRFAGQADAFAGGLEGLIAQGQDVREVANGIATRDLTQSIKGIYQAALRGDNQQLIQAMAASINAGISPVAGMIEASARGLLGGGFTSGLSEGIKAGKSLVEGTVIDFGLNSVLAPFKKVFGIESPSKVMHEQGLFLMQGLANGIQEGSGPVWQKLKEFAEAMGFVVTSTTGGKHNKGSKHYKGLAIDVRTRDKTPEQIERFIAEARAQGIEVKDERTRPPGQKVWGGPHLDLSAPRGWSPQPFVVSEYSSGNAVPVRVMNAQELAGFKPPAGAVQLTKTPVYENGRVVGYDASEAETKAPELPTGTPDLFKSFLTNMPPLAAALPYTAQRTNDALKDSGAAVKDWSKLVIMSGRDLKGAFAGIGGMLPQQQVGKKRGFFSKLLGIASPFLNFIPGVGPILSTLASIGSSALGGDWGGALMATAGGFASGGAFRRNSSASSSAASTTASSAGSSAGGAAAGALSGLPRRAQGGPVRRGRAYVVGERRAEVVEFGEDGYVHPSIDAYRRSQSSGGGGFSGGGKDGFWNQWREHFDRLAGAIEKFETMTPGEVLTKGAKTHPNAIGDGLMRAGSRDPKVVDWMRRRSAA